MPTVCVDAVKENLPNVIEFVTKMLGENADGKLVFELELICEEVFVNICNYAYGENVGKAEIEVSKLSDSIVVKFIDSGKKFNPLEIAEPNIHAPLEERSIGGLGIFMTKNFTDALPMTDLTAKTFLQLQEFLIKESIIHHSKFKTE